MIKLNESLVDEIFEQQKKLIAWDNYSSRLVWEEEVVTEKISASGYARAKKYREDQAREKNRRENPQQAAFFREVDTIKAAKEKRKAKAAKNLASNMKKEGYQRDPEKGEAEERKRSKRVRGERTPMPPRGDKRREDFEKWYAANVR